MTIRLYFVKREVVLKRLYFLQAARLSDSSFRMCLGRFLDLLGFFIRFRGTNMFIPNVRTPTKVSQKSAVVIQGANSTFQSQSSNRLLSPARQLLQNYEQQKVYCM